MSHSHLVKYAHDAHTRRGQSVCLSWNLGRGIITVDVRVGCVTRRRSTSPIASLVCPAQSGPPQRTRDIDRSRTCVDGSMLERGCIRERARLRVLLHPRECAHDHPPLRHPLDGAAGGAPSPYRPQSDRGPSGTRGRRGHRPYSGATAVRLPLAPGRTVHTAFALQQYTLNTTRWSIDASCLLPHLWMTP